MKETNETLTGLIEAAKASADGIADLGDLRCVARLRYSDRHPEGTMRVEFITSGKYISRAKAEAKLQESR